jgi:hypothetical protein
MSYLVGALNSETLKPELSFQVGTGRPLGYYPDPVSLAWAQGNHNDPVAFLVLRSEPERGVG